MATQAPEYSVEETRENPFSLVAALNETGEAVGLLYWDDGESLNTTQNGEYFLSEFYVNATSSQGTFSSFVLFDKYFSTNSVLVIFQVNINKLEL